MRKTTIFTFTLLSLAILPAIAQIQTGLGGVWTDFQAYSTDLQNYLQYNLSDNLKPVETESQIALNTDKGELNIPNPIAAGKQVRNQLTNPSAPYDSRANRFENNSAVWGNSVSNELNRVITRGVAVGILGRNGQNRAKAKLESTEESLKNITKFADDNQIETKIQSLANNTDIVKSGIAGLAEVLGLTQLQNTQIQQEQVKIVAETFAQTIQNNQSLQYSNLNLANISQQSEEANRARRVETSTEAARLLRATSQMDLFGRTVNK
ncbi:hypothetical protein H6G97_14065 [Nostoc flagelliforme FACHB-838]|uniref:Uncharacterized protein n=1 Tax=Nostoc flagelliforme FACHB-838 TaxID=2692904 RepID=A0ABR8DNZ9_9NOSO|nr:hypothetical protein [Nostoc flagelliforme]MBD2530636.1 hypothetical protein [Nostoc flagelliforme FACHB-838]